MVKAFVRDLALAFIEQLVKRITTGGGVPTGVAVFTDADVTQATDLVRMLDRCRPMTKDLDQKLIKSICSKLKAQDEFGARQLIETAKTGLERPWCIAALKGAMTLVCNCGPRIVKEATFNLLGC
jgi:hypothetical protein